MPVKITIDVVHKVNKTILFSFVIVDELEANEEYTGRRRYHSMPNSENEIMFLDLSLEMHCKLNCIYTYIAIMIIGCPI